LPSVFRARRRLTTSATATTYGHSARSSHNPRRDGHRDALPFLYLSRPLPCGSGDRRRAAQRPPIQTPVPVPPGFHQVFPTAIPVRARHLRELPRRSTSGDQRARVRGPSEGRVICQGAREPHFCVLASGACASKSACGRRSLPRRPLDIRCRRCVAERGGDPFSSPDRTKIHVPTLTREGQRHPADRDAFHRCVRVRRKAVGLLRRPNPARRSLAHAAHTFSTSCGVCLHGPCKHQSAVTRDPWHSRNKRLCYRWGRSFRISRAWD